MMIVSHQDAHSSPISMSRVAHGSQWKPSQVDASRIWPRMTSRRAIRQLEPVKLRQYSIGGHTHSERDWSLDNAAATDVTSALPGGSWHQPGVLGKPRCWHVAGLSYARRAYRTWPRPTR